MQYQITKLTKFFKAVLMCCALTIHLSHADAGVSTCAEALVVKTDRSLLELLFPGLQEDYPEVARRVNPRALERLKRRQSEEWLQFKEQILNCKNECSVKIKTKQIFALIKVEYSEPDERGLRILAIKIRRIRAFSGEGFFRKMVPGLYGRKLKKINLQLMKLAEAIFNSTLEIVEEDSSISMVQLEASTVVNKSLAEMLVSLGFQKKSGASHVSSILVQSVVFSPKIAYGYYLGFSPMLIKGLFTGYYVYSSVIQKQGTYQIELPTIYSPD